MLHLSIRIYYWSLAWKNNCEIKEHKWVCGVCSTHWRQWRSDGEHPKEQKEKEKKKEEKKEKKEEQKTEKKEEKVKKKKEKKKSITLRLADIAGGETDEEINKAATVIWQQ